MKNTKKFKEAMNPIPRKKFSIKKTLATVLSIFILISISPTSIFASAENAATDFSINYSELTPDAVTTNDSSLDTIREIVSRREENIKHFLLPDGTVEAIIYNSPVHRKDNDGIWQDIDNRLNDNNSNQHGYITSDGRIVFSKKLNTNTPEIFKISENGYSIEVTFNNENFKNCNAKLSNHAEKYIPSETDSFEEQYKKLKMIDNTTTLLYKNLLKGIDFEYKIFANNIKENIIINKRSEEYIYSFIYKLEGLDANLNENGSISLKDNITREEKYNISSPFMYDANGEISYSIYYTLEEISSGQYIISLIADHTWINDEKRELPVVIDPLIESSRVVWDTYVNALNSSSNYGRSSTVQVSDHCTAFFKNNMPTLPSGSTVENATWYGAYYNNIGMTYQTTLEAHTMENGWDEFVETYNTLYNYYGSNLGISSTVLDSKTISVSPNYNADNPAWISFDVTNAVKSWCGGSTYNYGIAITIATEATEGNHSTSFISYEAGTPYTSYYKIKYTEPRLEDGIYRIKSRNGLYMTVAGNGIQSGSELILAEDSALDGGNPSYNQLFKISYECLDEGDSSNCYVIRPMTNCLLSIYTSVFRKSDPVAAEMSVPQGWSINSSGNYYTIVQRTSSDLGLLMTSPTTSSTNQSISVTECTLGDIIEINTQWSLEKYECNVEGTYLISNPSMLRCEETYDFNAYMRSSKIGINGPIKFLVANDDFSETDKATIDERTGVLTAYKTGKIKVGLTFTGTNSRWWYSIEIVTSNGWRNITPPTIKSRSDWNARNKVEDRLVERIRNPQRIIFHHSAEKFSSINEDDVIAEIQRIQNEHMDDRKKCDIAYHFIIDPYGRIWQGAEIDGYQRGHAEGYYDDIGVLVLGVLNQDY